VFDCDNTLTDPYSPYVNPLFKESFEECLSVFSGKTVIFSNSAGSTSDKGYQKAQLLEKHLNVPVLRHTQQKPGGIASLVSHLKCDPQEMVMIGDRYFTDVFMGNLHGMLTVRTEPFTEKGENFIVILARRIENFIINSLKKNNVLPVNHHLSKKNILN